MTRYLQIKTILLKIQIFLAQYFSRNRLNLIIFNENFFYKLGLFFDRTDFLLKFVMFLVDPSILVRGQ